MAQGVPNEEGTGAYDQLPSLEQASAKGESCLHKPTIVWSKLLRQSGDARDNSVVPSHKATTSSHKPKPKFSITIPSPSKAKAIPKCKSAPSSPTQKESHLAKKKKGSTEATKGYQDDLEDDAQVCTVTKSRGGRVIKKSEKACA